jgi:glucokinase
VLVERYRERLHLRHAGHPGEAFLPELDALARRAEPVRRGAILDVDTTQPLDREALAV